MKKTKKGAMSAFLKKELKDVLDTQRNDDNKEDCALQCYGIAQFVQKGILPTGPIPTGSKDKETLFAYDFNISTSMIGLRPKQFEKFKSLMDNRRPLLFQSTLLKKMDKSLREEASKEVSGFVHGLLTLYRNNYTLTGHCLYFFATQDEVIYVDNQCREEKNTTYPFYDSLPESLIFNEEDNNFRDTITYVLIGNWFCKWGVKNHVNKILQDNDLNSIDEKPKLGKKRKLGKFLPEGKPTAENYNEQKLFKSPKNIPASPNFTLDLNDILTFEFPESEGYENLDPNWDSNLNFL